MCAVGDAFTGVFVQYSTLWSGGVRQVYKHSAVLVVYFLEILNTVLYVINIYIDYSEGNIAQTVLLAI